MFDFEKLDVYTDARRLVKKVLSYLYSHKMLDPTLKDQLKRGVTSILFNLAEGAGRMSKRDKKHFYTIARSSAFECVAILQVMLDLNQLDLANYQEFYQNLEKVSKMLWGMIKANS